jgi:hypothetical protein
MTDCARSLSPRRRGDAAARAKIAGAMLCAANHLRADSAFFDRFRQSRALRAASYAKFFLRCMLSLCDCSGARQRACGGSLRRQAGAVHACGRRANYPYFIGVF